MNSRAIFLLLSIFWAIITTSSTTDMNSEKCEYHETIDLTNQTRNFDGSYEYQGIVIKPEDQALYNYTLEIRNTNVTSPQHLRGCVCNKWKSCIKLCCEIDAFYNETSFKCEKIQKYFNLTWDVPVVLNNSSGMLVNIFEQFIYQVGVPCKQAIPLIMDRDVWILLENGTLNMTMDNALLSTVNYCFTPYKFNGSSEYLLTPFSCPISFEITWTLLLNTYAMAVSVIFLIPTIVVYLVIKQLRGNLRGKLLICYLVSLVIAYGIISYINISSTQHEIIPCSILGYTCYFFFMAAYLWLSVLCYDIWKNFREVNFELNSCENIQRFVYYSLYTWIGAGIFTSLTIWADLSTSVPENLKPGIGERICFLDTTKWSASIYFYGPNFIILLFNFATFTYLTVHIYKVRQDSAKITHKEYFFRENAVVILRLFLVMGVSWIFDILSYSLPDDDKTQYAFVLSDLLNATQGILIFVFFVLKRNVLELLKKRFSSIKAARLRCSSTTSSPTASTNLQTFR